MINITIHEHTQQNRKGQTLQWSNHTSPHLSQLTLPSLYELAPKMETLYQGK